MRPRTEARREAQGQDRSRRSGPGPPAAGHAERRPRSPRAADPRHEYAARACSRSGSEVRARPISKVYERHTDQPRKNNVFRVGLKATQNSEGKTSNHWTAIMPESGRVRKWELVPLARVADRTRVV